jgi:arylsulfatase A-like enzyme
MVKTYLHRFLWHAATLLLTGISLAAIPALGADKAAPRHDNTNVILISLQCLRPDHLGVYGYQRATSHNIDRLAAQSVLFENAISQANLTPVAQMSVLTSQYPRINGMVSFEVAKDQVSQRTLPEILKMYGYTTAATVSSPEFFLRYDGAGVTVNPGDLFSRSFDYFGRTRKGPDGRSVRKVPTEALQWLKNNRDRKFFLWIASGLIHMPYGAAVPTAYRKMYDQVGYVPFWKRLSQAPAWKELGEDPDYDVFSRIYRGEFYWGFSPIYRLTNDDVAYVNGRYDAGVYYTDLFIGELLKQLDALKLTEKTVIILQSIHGEDLGDRGGNFFHYDVNDTIIKNALMVRFPGQELGGRRVTEQVQAIDIMPTLLDYLQIPVPHEAQGMSLMPFLRGDRSAAPEEFAYIDRLPWWEYTLDKWYLEFKRSQGAPFAQSEQEKLPAYRDLLTRNFAELGYPPGDIAIRTNDWKLILRKNPALLQKVSWPGFLAGREPEISEVELYDLKKDPGETKNIAPANQEVVKRLREKLLQWDKEMELGKKAFNPDDQRQVIPYP